MKATLILTLLGMTGVFVQPLVAQSTGMMEPLPAWGQMGISGSLSFILWWIVTKTQPAMQEKIYKSHQQNIGVLSEGFKQGLDGVTTEVKGLRDDVNSNMKQQIDILRGQVR